MRSLLDAGSYEGQVYGIAPGINGMALWYNKDMFEVLRRPAAHHLGRGQGCGRQAHHRRGVRHRLLCPGDGKEGSWQFEPWFWGAGGGCRASLTLRPKASRPCSSGPTWSTRAMPRSPSCSGAKAILNDTWPARLPCSRTAYGTWAPSKHPASTLVSCPSHARRRRCAGPMGGEVLTIPHRQLGEDGRRRQAGQLPALG